MELIQWKKEESADQDFSKGSWKLFAVQSLFCLYKLSHKATQKEEEENVAYSGIVCWNPNSSFKRSLMDILY